MPKLFKQNLLSSPLDTPELPKGETGSNDQEAESDPVKTLLSWKASSRPYVKRNRSYYTYATVIVALIVLISLLAQWFLLVGAVLALLFLIYVINFVPPDEIEYKISTQGVTIGDHFYHWQELNSFWFINKDGFRLLYIATQIRFPAVLIIVLGEESEEEVKKTVAKFLPFHEIPPKTLIDRWSEGLQKHFPLENPHH